MRVGFDMGSRKVKLALLDEEQQVIDVRLYDTIDFYKQYGLRNNGGLQIDFDRLGLTDCTSVVTTGYGRNTLNFSGAAVIPELKAHMLGAIHQTGLQDFTLLDLGGQDSKVICVRNGKMTDFQTNDKCAASTGRYLENMAHVLGVSLQELSLHDHEPVELSSTCAIFGESELIGKILEGHSPERLAAGVNYTIFKRIKPMLMAMKSQILIFTGGVAHSPALRRILERETNFEQIVVPQYPQYNGAIGCGVYMPDERKRKIK